MTEKTAREVIAERIASGTHINDTIGGSEVIKYARVDADLILAALDAAGFQIVPKEPTAEMIDAPEYGDVVSDNYLREAWTAMLAAAPK